MGAFGLCPTAKLLVEAIVATGDEEATDRAKKIAKGSIDLQFALSPLISLPGYTVARQRADEATFWALRTLYDELMQQTAQDVAS